MGKSRVRKLSAKVKDWHDVVLGGKLKKEPGTFSVHESLKRYEKDKVTAVRVRLYLDPMKAKGFGFGHEFLVVDLQTLEKHLLVIRAEKDYVTRVDVMRAEKDDAVMRVEKDDAVMRAEKDDVVMRSEKDDAVMRAEKDDAVMKAEKDDAVMDDEKPKVGGVIKVTPIDDRATFEKENKNRVRKCDVDLQGCGKILLKDLFHILDDCNRCYSLWEHNCWKYAYDTLKRLLEKFAGLADTSDDSKKKIREALEKLPRPSLPAEIFAKVAAHTSGSGMIAAELETQGLSGPCIAYCIYYTVGHVGLKDIKLMRKQHVVPRKRE